MENQETRGSPILLGDCRLVMQGLEPESFHTCITSPPYWGLRDYGIPLSEWPSMSYSPMTGMPEINIPSWTGCLGLEPTPEMFVGHIVQVFREVWRVLRNDGTLWMNFGDAYATSGYKVHSSKTDVTGWDVDGRGQSAAKTAVSGLKIKDLMGMPWRCAFALQVDGWYLRSDIIWNKPNCMPESANDRPTKAHEDFFLLSKKQTYYYDAEAIKEPMVYGITANGVGFGHGTDSEQRDRGRISVSEPKGNAKTFRGGGVYIQGQSFENSAKVERDSHGNHPNETGMRNKRSVWTVATQPFPEAHFATFPEKLIEPPILAGSSPQSCPHCAAPWKRVIVKTGHINKREIAHVPGNSSTKTDSTGWAHTSKGTDIFEPSCKCENNDGSAKCRILDPFGGSGTTRKVALENNRECTSIDINPEYVDMQKRRTATIQPKLF